VEIRERRSRRETKIAKERVVETIQASDLWRGQTG
jgi:hypothetical protein